LPLASGAFHESKYIWDWIVLARVETFSTNSAA